MYRLALRVAVSLITFIIGLGITSIWPAGHFDSFSPFYSNSAEQEVRQLDRQFFQAYLNRDIGTFDRLLSDDFTFTFFCHQTVDKAERLEQIENPALIFEDVETSDVQVSMGVGEAVVTGRAMVRGNYQGQEYTTPTYRFQHRYERRDGRWKMVTARDSLLAWRL